MKSFSSILAWLLLAAVLAVPSFLFYNWWSKSSKKSSAEVTPGPVTVNVFPSEDASRSAAAGYNPASPAAQPAARPAASPAAQPAARPAAQPAVQPDIPAPAEAQAPVEQPAAEQAAESQSGQEAQVAESSAAPLTVSYFAPKGDRDPTLSPEDYRRIKEAIRQREEAERMSRLAERSKPREPGPETLITLQGIVGNAAIINGDMVNTGQSVRGVKIVKIGADYIIGEHKGKRFRKVLK